VPSGGCVRFAPFVFRGPVALERKEKMKSIITIPAVLALILIGTVQAAPDKNQKTKTVSIDSDPPGMRIYFGGGASEERAQASREYLGTTPLKAEIPCKKDGTFLIHGALLYSAVVAPVAIFTAEPPVGSTNLFIQYQRFHQGASVFVSADKVPPAIFFDMHKPAP
jgi:hypothetical protein